MPVAATQYNEPLSTTRVAPDQLKGLIEGLDNDRVDAIINIAHVKTQEVKAAPYWKTYGKSTALYKDENEDLYNDYDPVEIVMGFIELSLAQHFCTIANGGQISGMKADGFSLKYFEVQLSAVGFGSTLFGQQAILLDNSDTLVNAGKPKARLYLGRKSIRR